MWFRLMMIAFFFNGLCPFGLRILAGMGLADHYTPLYLVFWYFAGAIAMLVIFSRAPVRPARFETALQGFLISARGLSGDVPAIT